MASRRGDRSVQDVAAKLLFGGEKLERFRAKECGSIKGIPLGPVLRSALRGIGAGAKLYDFCWGGERSRTRGAPKVWSVE